jgi:dual specificity protein phosphatase-like protein
MYMIRPWLYIGKYSETQESWLLRSCQIGAMLQLDEAVEQPGIVSLFLPIEDGEPLAPEGLKRGLDFVQAQKSWGRNVLIACGAGVSRAVTFAIAALKEEEKLSLLDAVREVHARHAEALPHPELWKSLCQYYGENLTLMQMLEILRP